MTPIGGSIDTISKTPDEFYSIADTIITPRLEPRYLFHSPNFQSLPGKQYFFKIATWHMG